MSTKTGLQVFNADGEVYLDLTSRPTLILGEADIYPTAATNICSGTFASISWDYNSFHFFFMVQKVYTSNIDLINSSRYFQTPKLTRTLNWNSSPRRVDLTWEYEYDNYNNLGVHVIYGVY